MFVDASAIIAILSEEPEARALSRTLDGAPSPITTSIAVYEATLGLRRKRGGAIAEAQRNVHDFLKLARIRLVAIAPDEADRALIAFARYGKGQGHPAQLNMGDCFAYAVAQSHKSSLLFKGEDFARTDIPAAIPAPPF